jgi:hypothetical protein
MNQKKGPPLDFEQQATKTQSASPVVIGAIKL